MSIFQLISILFATFMVYVVRVKSKKYHLPRLETWAWYSVWALFAFVAVFPGLLLGVVHTLNFGRVFDLLVVIAFMIVTSVLTYLYFAVKDLQAKLERDVRKEALSERKSKRDQ